MSDHVNDEKFEEFLQREARSYNAPPQLAGRDELFASIMAARRNGDGRWKMEDGKWRPRMAWVGMAAMLVLGVAIGKFALGTHDIPATVAPLAATNPAGAPAAGGNTDAPAGAARAGNVSYNRAATAELSRAEALLTAYGTSSANTGVDKHLSAWARDILTNTRLLLDSPAADDPARRRLLQDLELVLVQMVQRSPQAGVSDERAQIDRSMERTQVLTRLRSALPAGPNN
ncbi:MAG: hypothetical protein ACHQSE_08525 [Gemmatimonadales bacterium]